MKSKADVLPFCQPEKIKLSLKLEDDANHLKNVKILCSLLTQSFVGQTLLVCKVCSQLNNILFLIATKKSGEKNLKKLKFLTKKLDFPLKSFLKSAIAISSTSHSLFQSKEQNDEELYRMIFGENKQLKNASCIDSS